MVIISALDVKLHLSRIKAIAEEYKGKINLIFRNYPLVSIHPNALAAASVAEAAGLQGKYWQMHDLLYDKTRRMDIRNS